MFHIDHLFNESKKAKVICKCDQSKYSLNKVVNGLLLSTTNQSWIHLKLLLPWQTNKPFRRPATCSWKLFYLDWIYHEYTIYEQHAQLISSPFLPSETAEIGCKGAFVSVLKKKIVLKESRDFFEI